MHKVQAEYAAVKAAWIVVLEETNALIRAIPSGLSEEQECEMIEAAETKTGMVKANEALRAAEDAMIDWAVATVRKAHRKHAAWKTILLALPEMRSKYAYRYQLVDLCFALNA